MTPTALRLRARLDDRRRWFQNEWFYKWHFIGRDGPVSIDSFDGRDIHFGGIEFSGTVRDVYWDALVRGVHKEIIEQFAWVDQEVRNYNRETALTAIVESAGQLMSFVKMIRRIAIDKDRVLLGSGSKLPAIDDAGYWDGTSDRDIESQANALKAALPLTVENSAPAVTAVTNTMRHRATVIWNEHQGWIGPVGLLIGLAGLLPLFF